MLDRCDKDFEEGKDDNKCSDSTVNPSEIFFFSKVTHYWNDWGEHVEEGKLSHCWGGDVRMSKKDR